MKKYVLKAKTEDEVVYFMNVIMVTPQIEYAEKFNSEEEARNKIENFENLFFGEKPEISVVEA